MSDPLPDIGEGVRADLEKENTPWALAQLRKMSLQSPNFAAGPTYDAPADREFLGGPPEREFEELRKAFGLTAEEAAEARRLAEADLSGEDAPEIEHRKAVRLARNAPAAGCVLRVGAGIQVVK